MNTRKRRPLRGLVVLAAVLALLAALSVTAFALNLFGLRDALLPGKHPVSVLDENGIRVPDQVAMVDMLSMSGYMDSPESQALNEWNAFLTGYDVEGAAQAADEAARQGQADASLAKYGAYTVYNREMADKLDAILTKYGLSLVGEDHPCTTQAEWIARLNGDFLGNVRATTGWMYDNGAFSFDAELPRPGKDEIIDFQFHRAVKGFFDGILLNIQDAASYEQWEYRSASGETVLLALGPSKGLVLADFDDCFVTLNVLSGAESAWAPELGQTPLTRADLEYIADSVDFRLLHPVVPYAQTQGTEPAPAPEPEAPPVSPSAEANGLTLPGEFLPLLLGGAGDKGFSNTLTGETMNLQDYCRWRTPAEETELARLYQFAPIDLDGDGAAELVLWEGWKNDLSYGCLVLHVRDGHIDGYPVTFRALQELKADGTYSSASGSGDFSVSRMHFTPDGSMEEEILASENYYYDILVGEEEPIWEWKLDGKSVSQAEFTQWMDAWNRRPSVSTYTFDEGSREATVKEVFGVK